MSFDQAFRLLPKTKTPEAYHASLTALDEMIVRDTKKTDDLVASHQAKILELSEADFKKLEDRIRDGVSDIERMKKFRAAIAEGLPEVERNAKLAELRKRAQEVRVLRDKSVAWLEQRYPNLQQELAGGLQGIVEQYAALGYVQREAMALDVTDAERESFGLLDLAGAEGVVLKKNSVKYFPYLPTEVSVFLAFPPGNPKANQFIGKNIQRNMPMPNQPPYEPPAQPTATEPAPPSPSTVIG